MATLTISAGSSAATINTAIAGMNAGAGPVGGDVVEFQSGTYSFGTGSWTLTGINGSVGNPVTFRPVTSPTDVLNAPTVTFSSTKSYVSKIAPTFDLTSDPNRLEPDDAMQEDRTVKLVSCNYLTFEKFKFVYGISVAVPGDVGRALYQTYTSAPQDGIYAANQPAGVTVTSSITGIWEKNEAAHRTSLQAMTGFAPSKVITIKNCAFTKRGIFFVAGWDSIVQDNIITDGNIAEGCGILVTRSLALQILRNDITQVRAPSVSGGAHFHSEAIRLSNYTGYCLVEGNTMSEFEGLLPRGCTEDGIFFWNTFRRNTSTGANYNYSVQHAGVGSTYDSNTSTNPGKAHFGMGRDSYTFTANAKPVGQQHWITKYLIKCNTWNTGTPTQESILAAIVDCVFDRNKLKGAQDSSNLRNLAAADNFQSRNNLWIDANGTQTILPTDAYMTANVPATCADVAPPTSGVAKSALLESGTLSEWSSTVGDVQVTGSPNPVYAGSYALRLNAGANQAVIAKWTGLNYSAVYATEFRVYCPGLTKPTANRTVYEVRTGASTVLGRLIFTTNGKLQVEIINDAGSTLTGTEGALDLTLLSGWAKVLVEMVRSSAGISNGFIRAQVLEPVASGLTEKTGVLLNSVRWTTANDKQVWYSNWK